MSEGGSSAELYPLGNWPKKWVVEKQRKIEHKWAQICE
jgi:hypothetical protein